MMGLTLVVLLLITTCINAEKSKLKTSEVVGSTDGFFWSDEQEFHKYGQITQIEIASSNAVNGFRIKYGKTWGRWHGGTSGDVSSFLIEDIIEIRGLELPGNRSRNGHVMSIEFTTGGGTRFGSFGKSSVGGYKYKRLIRGCHVAFVSGYTGAVGWLLRVKGITFHWECQSSSTPGNKIIDSGVIGSKTGRFWSDKDVYDKNGPITQFAIRSSNTVNGLRVKYGKAWGRWHGGTSGETASFNITNITSIKGIEFHGNETITGRIISMELTASDGSRFGPFGNTRGEGTKFNTHLTGCRLAFISGYTGAVGWLLKVKGMAFHWLCEGSNDSRVTAMKIVNTFD